jgi:hypothetical protein
MLEAGGMEVVVDHLRKPDDDNPLGYYELEKVKKIKEDASFLDHAYGKVLKIVSMLLYHLPNDKKYKIIFMKRNMEEILSSQRIMLERRGKKSESDRDKDMGRIFGQHIDEVTSWLARQDNVEVIYVNYNDVIAHPLTNAQMVNQFLGNRLDVQKMVAAVDQTLYRNRVPQN